MTSNNADKKLKKHMLLSTIYKPISMIISLIYVPIFLNCLGDEKYGVWVTISSILSWLTQFDVGIGNGLRNKLSEYYAKDDRENSKGVVSTSYCILTVVSIVVFVLFVLISFIFDIPDFMGIKLDSEPVNIVLIIAAASVCLNFVLGLCGTIFYAIQESSVVSLKGIVVQVGQLMVALVLTAVSNSNLIIVAALYGLAEIITNVCFSFYLFYRKKFLIPSVKKYNKIYFNEVVSLGLQFFILQICTLVIYSTDNMIISKYIGPSEVTPYSIVHNVFSLVIVVHTALNMPMWSTYTAALTNKDYGYIKKNLLRILGITLILSIGTIIAIPLFKPAAKIWLQKELVYPVGLIALEAVYTILALISNTFSSLLSGVNYVKKTVYISVIQAIVNIPLSLYCALNLDMGIVGVKIGSVIALAVSAIANPLWSYEWYTKEKKKLEDKSEKR